MNAGLPFQYFIAPYRGTAQWSRDAELRRLALRPLLIGVLVYCLMLVGIYFSQGGLYRMLTPNWDGLWLTIIKPLSWLLSWLLLLGFGIVAGLSASIAASGFYHEEIATVVFTRHNGHRVESSAPKSRAVEAGRVVARELVKLAIIISLSLFSLFISFIPGVAPLALLFNSWLIGFEMLDLTTGVLGAPFRSRLRWMIRNWISVACVGAAFLVVGFIPFVPLLLAPGAVAGLATLLAEAGSDSRKGLIPSPSPS